VPRVVFVRTSSGAGAEDDGLLLGADVPGPSVLSLQPPAASASRTSSETAVDAGRVDVLMAREIPSWGPNVA
jgi:hypothetical protein